LRECGATLGILADKYLGARAFKICTEDASLWAIYFFHEQFGKLPTLHSVTLSL